MNIDLLIDKNDQAGLVSDTPFEDDLESITFDYEKGDLYLSFENPAIADKPLNIPVDSALRDTIYYQNQIFFGVLEGRTLTDARLVPLKLMKIGKKKT